MNDLRETAVTPDGWEYDPETGEILGHALTGRDFEVTDVNSAEWALRVLSEAEGEIAGVEARLTALTSMLMSLRAHAERKRNWWYWKFSPSLIAYARSTLGKKGKTALFSWGQVKFRATKGSNQILDMDQAVEWMRAFAPDRVKRTVKETVTIQDILAVRAQVAAMTGEPPDQLPWLVEQGPGENVTISTGIAIEAAAEVRDETKGRLGDE